jgi:hypothetical protein
MTDIDTLELENRLLRQRNDRLEAVPAQIIARLEKGFGASHAAPLMIRQEFLGAEPKLDMPKIGCVQHDCEQCKAAEKQGPVANDGWLQDGSLLYRLTDECHPRNRDEIRVTLADGSHSVESCTRRAGEVLNRIRATSPAAQRQPLTDAEIFDAISNAVKKRVLSWVGFEKDVDGRYTVPSIAPYHFQLARAIEQAHGIGSKP